MCGIAGFWGQGTETDLRGMIDSIRYRGPDFQGTFLKDNIGLAHARLSILDLRPEGNQPMLSEDGTLAIVFNGEIYNYLSLKKELEPEFSFRTNTDTEVLLYLYRRYGLKMLEQIHGMFAFALYDFQKKELLLVRDRMGKKPLYYSSSSSAFVFASELKAVLQHPGISKELNLEALNQYLTFDYVPTPNSILKNIYKLEPASYLLLREGKVVEKGPYWKHDFSINTNIRFEDAKNKLDNLLNDAVASRLMSDVPLGVFLSGGLDSSTVAWYAQRNSTQKIQTFSIGFQDPSYDESDHAATVAKHIGTDHHSQILKPGTALNLIDEIYDKVDEPFADASLIPTYFLSKFTRQHVTVALGGDGSDELLVGYPTFLSDYFKNALASLPHGMIQGMNALASTLLPSSDKNISLDFKIRQFLRGFSSDKDHIHQLWLGSFLPLEKKELFNASVHEQLSDKTGLSQIDKHFAACPPADNFHKLVYYYYQTYLLDDILVKVDRASMYNSLEVRAPFLDRKVVEFVNTLPASFKRKGFEGKYILKKLMDGRLPQNIIWRPKKGFGIPLSDWLRKDLKVMSLDLMSAENIKKIGIFNVDFIQRLLREHNTGKANHRKLLWNLLMFLKWHKAFMK